MNKTLSVAVVLAATVCTATVWSQSGRRGGPGPGGPPGMGMPMMSCPAMAVMPPPSFTVDQMAERLQLRPEQVRKLRSILSTNEKTLRSLHQSTAKSSRALRSAVLAPRFDAKKVKTLAAQASSAEARSVTASIAAWIQIRSTLSAAQVAKLQKSMTMRPPGPGMRPGTPPPPGPMP